MTEYVVHVQNQIVFVIFRVKSEVLKDQIVIRVIPNVIFDGVQWLVSLWLELDIDLMFLYILENNQAVIALIQGRCQHFQVMVSRVHAGLGLVLFMGVEVFVVTKTDFLLISTIYWLLNWIHSDKW